MINKIYYIFIVLFILFLFYSYHKMKCVENFSTNLINNGSFENGNHSSNNTGIKIGNNIIKLRNPGHSSYVLRQTAADSTNNHKIRYELRKNIQSDTNYKIGCWVAYTNNWDGNYDLFTIIFYDDSGEIILPETNKGTLIKNQKINDINWEYLEFSFNSPSNSNGILEIYLGYDPNNTKGYRYITNLELVKDYPLIPNLTITTNLIGFFSSNLNSELKNITSNIWKDLSQEGNDIKFGSPIEIIDNKINLNDTGYGNKSNILIPDPNNFTIFWACEFNENNQGDFIKLLSNNSNNDLLIRYNNEFGINNNIEIHSMGEIKTLKIGITQKYTQYCLVNSNNNYYLYVDNIKFNLPLKNKNNIKFSDDKLIINGQKTLQGKLETFIIYSYALKSKEVEQLSEYINGVRYKDKFISRPSISSTNSNIIFENHLIKNKINCPFNSKSDESPCNSKQCCNIDWSNVENIPNNCKIEVEDYCKKNEDNTCNFIEKKRYENEESQKKCSSSHKIFSQLNLNQLNIEKKIAEINSNKCMQDYNISDKDIYNNNDNQNNNNDNQNNNYFDNINIKDFTGRIFKILKKEKKNLKKRDNRNTDKNINTDNNIVNNEKKCEIDLDKYIRKDKIPCWGCKLD